MTVYNNFIGIDIGKYSFVVTAYESSQINEYENTSCGIEKFINEYNDLLLDGLCILETTGGYEMELLLALCHGKYAVHRANTRKVKHFIRSYGNEAKTDPLDAKALARYGHERTEHLQLYAPANEQAMELYAVVKRRQDLKQMMVAEKNRLQTFNIQFVKASCQAMIKMFTTEINVITKEINTLIDQDADLKEKKKILKGIPGIGDIIANELLVLLPELGQVNRRQIASLVGVAPKANDSGRYRGYRATYHGRAGIKPNLFLAAMAARNSNSPFKEFYEQLIGRGKLKMVALTALMRKIIVIANARLKEYMVKDAKRIAEV